MQEARRSIAQKARAAARVMSSDRTRYPALRLRPLTLGSAQSVLVALDFDEGEVEKLDRDYAAARDELWPRMLDRARRNHAFFAGAEQVEGSPQTRAAQEWLVKMSNREYPAHESTRLVYLATRLSVPNVVVETGTLHGTLSTFVLRGLADNGVGRLVSLDLPAYDSVKKATLMTLPPGEEPGWIVPDELRSRFELVLGDSRRTLKPTLREHGPIGIFIHDSLHTTRHMSFEYRLAWSHLQPGGLLISDDIFETASFWWLAKSRRVPFHHIGNVGITRKPAPVEPEPAE